MKVKSKSIIALFAIITILMTIMPINVFAESNANRIGITVSYRNNYGIVQYSLNDGQDWTDITIAADVTTANALKLRIVPNSGYEIDWTGIALEEGDNRIELNNTQYEEYRKDLMSNAGYTCPNTVSKVSLSDVEFRQQQNNNENPPPEPGEPGGTEQKTFKFDFRLNGVDFTDIECGNITVPDNFNMDKITEFYIKKIVVIGENETETYNYNNNEYSYSMLDDQGRTILETHFDKNSNNYATLRVQSHSQDIQDKDKIEGRIYYDFYITGINLVKSNFKGVEAFTSVMPDNYDFTGWNGVDLSETTKANPGKVTVYYGEDTINFDSIVASDIKKISLVTNSGVPSSAVSISNTDKTVQVLSNYYNEIPLEIELEDGTKGYVTVDRIGIFVDRLNAGNKVFYHGASADVGENMNVDTDKDRIVAVFYHEDTKTYNDYDLIVNMVFKDGSTKTTIAKGVGDIANSHGDIIGSDYLLWSGDRKDEPVEVYVTAVSKNALSNSNTFGGATLGSGAGVKWIND